MPLSLYLTSAAAGFFIGLAAAFLIVMLVDSYMNTDEDKDNE